MISQTELNHIKRLIDLAMMQTRQDECGRYMFQVKDLLLRYRMTLADVYTGGSYQEEDIPFDEPTQKADNNHKDEQPQDDLFDPTDSWVVPWAEKLEKNLSAKNIPDKDWGHLVRMQEPRFSTCRTLKDIQWLRDIARRNRQDVPSEYDSYIRVEQLKEKLNQ